jgi:hypothetical protein
LAHGKLRRVGATVAAVGHGDVIVAVLGTSAGIAGIVLVFLGLILAAYQSFAADTPPAVLDRFRRSTILTFGAFVVGIVSVVLATAWLIELQDHQALYVATLCVFMAQIAVTVIAAGWVVRQLVWGD